MTHNIIGHEDAGPHFVIRHAAPRRRSVLSWVRIVFDFAVCAVIVSAAWNVLGGAA